MLDKYKKNSLQVCRSLFIVLGALLMAAGMTIVRAQTPAASPAEEEHIYNGYRVTGVVEVGWRFRSLDGNEAKYRSDLNYKPGFRTFDSNILIESDTGNGKYFDSLLITNSGWGSDPTGYTRVNLEKIGYYKFTSTVRRISYYNNLSTFTAVADPNQHTQNTKNTMGDFDFTFFPQSDRLRINLGASFGDYKGPGTTTMRWNSDEFKVDSNTDNKTKDFRFGAEGKLIGFDWNLLESLRFYRDRSGFASTSLNQGHNATNTTVVSSFSRLFPTEGAVYTTQFNLHRTFADKLDFTGRVLYSSSDSYMNLNEVVTGRDASNNFIDQDLYTAHAESKRPQTRADLGITYNATDRFRISNTFTFDQYAITGDEYFTQDAIRRSAAGVPIAPTTARSSAWRYTGYRRLMNTLEADFQFNNRISAHIGWRYSERTVKNDGFDKNTVTGVVTPINTPAGLAEESNSTNTLIAGMKIKPAKNWSIYWDVEHGQADNVFGRLENYDFTNFRIRSKYTVSKFSFNVDVITKDNTNPTVDSTVAPSFGFTPETNVKSRFYNGSVTWDPDPRFNISGGYTYRLIDSFTPVIFPYQTCAQVACTSGTSTFNNGYSQFYMHDRFGYIEVAATPVKRVSLYATYRMNKDTGQDGEVSPTIPNTFPPPGTGVPVYKNIIGGYPMTFTMPEFRVAFRLTKNIDWNVGYQYYKYDDVNNPSQNYTAHLPFTSLRFYFGGPSADRIR